ncbi:apoptosis-antagonizing transcription factor [Xylariales sp. PMI_506]|nr:apoptosis-antagonizing transcription factor [Xylariales sp. PMI_506]
MGQPKGRKAQFTEWDEKPAKDYDPENEAPSDRDAASGSEDESADDNAGTEHYVSVGKSKLRRKEPVSLGPQYRGARVSRDALDQSSSESDDYEDAQEGFDDPDLADLERDQKEHDEDAEIESDGVFGESDEENFKDYTFRGSSQAMPVKGKRVTRPTAADFMDEEAEEDSEASEGEDALEEDEEDDDEDDEDIEDSDMEGFIVDDDEDLSDESVSENEEARNSALGAGDSDDEDQEGDDDDDDDDDESASEDEAPKKKRGNSDRNALSDLMAGTQSVAGAVASSIQKDIAKGVAVRQQRKAFDAALNIRIRLQKAMVAVNSFSAVDDADDQSEPYEAAEAAAVKLWNAIDAFRVGMQANPGKKRKRAELSTSNQDIWDSMQEVERRAAARRRAVLDNWSKKVKTTQTINTSAGHSRNGGTFAKVDEPLTMMLENQMQDPERLIKRTRTPRSCAPAQVAKKVNEDPDIYDDADFYQLLLKELVDQRTADTSSAGGQAATIRYAAVKEAKNKKHVDTKASKGRKMRFNVHEKLQNFMAPEDRRGWEQHAIDRFFSTLFGQKMFLNEDEVSDEDMDNAEEEGLRLFRN